MFSVHVKSIQYAELLESAIESLVTNSQHTDLNMPTAILHSFNMCSFKWMKWQLHSQSTGVFYYIKCK